MGKIQQARGKSIKLLQQFTSYSKLLEVLANCLHRAWISHGTSYCTARYRKKLKVINSCKSCNKLQKACNVFTNKLHTYIHISFFKISVTQFSQNISVWLFLKVKTVNLKTSLETSTYMVNANICILTKYDCENLRILLRHSFLEAVLLK